jgi:hypothetical protein
MKKVVLKWDRMSVLQKIQKTRFVVTKMTLNATVFPTPNPSLASMTALADTAESTEQNATQLGKDRIMARDAALVAMEDAMDLQVLYVQTVTLGDTDMTALAGMETQQVGSQWPDPDMPEGFKVRPGSLEGSVYMHCKATRYKKQYVFEMWVETKVVPGPDPIIPVPPVPPVPPAPAEGSEVGTWVAIQTQTSGRYQHVGLERGRIYRFRVYAKNSKGRSIASSEASCAAR